MTTENTTTSQDAHGTNADTNCKTKSPFSWVMPALIFAFFILTAMAGTYAVHSYVFSDAKTTALLAKWRATNTISVLQTLSLTPEGTNILQPIQSLLADEAGTKNYLAGKEQSACETALYQSLQVTYAQARNTLHPEFGPARYPLDFADGIKNAEAAFDRYRLCQQN